MAYIDLTYMKERVRERLLQELTDDSETPTGEIDEARVNKAISDADAFINTRLSRLYVTPITTPAESLTTLQRYEFDIALYYLFAEPIGREIPGEIKERYQNAITDLNSYATGVLSLDSTKTSTYPVAFVGSKTSTDKVYTDTVISTI